MPGHDAKQDAHRTLRVTQRMGIGGRGFLAVVQCDRQRFLIGVTPAGITRIGELSDELKGWDTSTSEDVSQESITAVDLPK